MVAGAPSRHGVALIEGSIPVSVDPTVYRLMMLIFRLARRLRGRRSLADGAALAITVERPDPLLDDGSHTPPHGDALFVQGGGELP